MEKEFITLYDLQSRLKEGVERLFPSKIWLRAEISAVKARVGGHCYMELSQSDENGIVAKAQAVVWSSKYRFIAPYFESVTGSPLREGMLVLVQVQVNFSQLYGLSLVVNDIDPAFSLGEQEKQRRLTEKENNSLRKRNSLWKKKIFTPWKQRHHPTRQSPRHYVPMKSPPMDSRP